MMRLSLFCVLLLVGNIRPYAQSSSTDEIDSIHLVVSKMLRKNNSDSALLLTQYTLKKSRTLDYIYGQARAMTLRGFYFQNKSHLDSAEAFFSQAHDLYLVNDIFRDSVKSKYAQLLLGLGSLNVGKRRFANAKDHLLTALRLYRKEQNDYRVFATLIQLGRNEAIQARYPDALEYFLKAYEMDSEELRQSKSIVIGNIGLCYYRMGHLIEGLKYMKEALAIDVSNGNKWSQISKLNNIGSIYTHLNKIDSANYYSRRAYELAKDVGQFKSAAIALSNMAQRYMLLEQKDLARKLMKEALELADSAGIPDMEEKFYMIRAELSLDRAEYDSVIYYGKKSLSLSRGASNRRFSSHTTLLLSKAYEGLSKMDSALIYYKEYYSIEDSLFNKENQRQFTELYAKIDNIEKQREIEILEKQREIDLANRIFLIFTIVSIVIFSVVLLVLLAYRHKNKQKKLRIKELELKKEIEVKEMELQQQTLHMINMNHNLSTVEDTLKVLKKQPVLTGQDIQRVLSGIMVNKSLEKEWNRFDTYFSKINPNFNKILSFQHQNLTTQERRLAALIKLDLSNREIASILNIEHRSVIMARYRLKKKCGLGDNEDLEVYIQTM